MDQVKDHRDMPLVALMEQLWRRIKSELDVTARELAPDLRPSHVRLLILTPAGGRRLRGPPRQAGKNPQQPRGIAESPPPALAAAALPRPPPPGGRGDGPGHDRPRPRPGRPLVPELRRPAMASLPGDADLTRPAHDPSVSHYQPASCQR